MKIIFLIVIVNIWQFSALAQVFYDQKPLKILKKQEASILSIAFQTDGKVLASGSEDKTCVLWNFPEATILNTITGYTNGVQAVFYTPDGTCFCTGSNKYIKIYKPSGEFVKTYGGPATFIWSLAYNPIVNQVIAGSYEKNIRMVDFATGKLSFSFMGHLKNALAVAFSPDGKLIASGSLDQTIKIWDLTSKKAIRTFEGHGGNIYSVLFTSDSKRVISASNDNSIRIWDIETGKTVMNLPGHTKGVSCMALSPDGNYLISGSYDTNIKLWELSSGECIYTFSGHSDAINAVAFHPEGKTFASGSSDKTIVIWELNPEIFVEHYYPKEFENEITQSILFASKGKNESKAEYKGRQEKAETFRQGLINKYYDLYISQIKGKSKK